MDRLQRGLISLLKKLHIYEKPEPIRNTTLNKINTTIGLFTQANNYRKTIQTWWVDRNTYSISITAKEPFYMDVRHSQSCLRLPVTVSLMGMNPEKNR
jgi:hypothetical protein